MVSRGISPEERAAKIAEHERRAEREAERRRFRERPSYRGTCRHESAHALAAMRLGIEFDHIAASPSGGVLVLAEPGKIDSREEAVRRIALCLAGPYFDGEEPQSNIATWINGEPGDLDIADQIASRFGKDAEDGRSLFAEGRALASRLVTDPAFRAAVEFLAVELEARSYIAGSTAEWLAASVEVAATC